MLVYPALGEELGPQGGVVGVAAAPHGGARQRLAFAYAAHLHAHVVGLDVDGDAVRVDALLQEIGDLDADALLHTEATAEEVHQARELGEADDVALGDVAYVDIAVEGQHVVFAQRMEGDRPLDDLGERTGSRHMALRLEGLDEVVIPVVPFGRLKERLDEALGGVCGGFALLVHPQGAEDLAGVPLEGLELLVGDVSLFESQGLSIFAADRCTHCAPLPCRVRESWW